MGSVGGFDRSHVVNVGGLRIDARRVPGCNVVPRGQWPGNTDREDEAPCLFSSPLSFSGRLSCLPSPPPQPRLGKGFLNVSMGRMWGPAPVHSDGCCGLPSVSIPAFSLNSNLVGPILKTRKLRLRNLGQVTCERWQDWNPGLSDQEPVHLR